jgi:fumarate reductase flavoprotein subunit
MNEQNKPRRVQLVILGGGASGLCAAVAAAEHGLTQIVVLEKQNGTGGMGRFAQGFFACESPVQQRQMFDITADDCFKIHMEWAHWARVDPPLVRAFLRRSADTIRWFEAHGVQFRLKKSWPNLPPVWHVPEGGGTAIMKQMRKMAEDAGVEILTNTAATALLQDCTGAVRGVRAERAGEVLEFSADAVILATGGFGGSPELLDRLCPAYDAEIPIGDMNRFNTGDGFRMAERAGAATAKTVPVLTGGHWPDSGMVPGSMCLIPVTTDPITVWVSADGKRFCDESAFYADFAAESLRSKTTYTIFDDSIRARLEADGPSNGGDAPGHSADVAGIPGLKEALDKNIPGPDGKPFSCVGTVEELAKFIGCDAATLQKTIDEYNAACACGYDAEFLKERRRLLPLVQPPFYAVRSCVNFHDTCGGVRVTPSMQVRDKRDRPIPGLYATGSLCDGVEPDVYNWKLCSFAFGFAINSGFMAGEQIAKDIL